MVNVCANIPNETANHWITVFCRRLYPALIVQSMAHKVAEWRRLDPVKNEVSPYTLCSNLKGLASGVTNITKWVPDRSAPLVFCRGKKVFFQEPAVVNNVQLRSETSGSSQGTFPLL